jgi:hypothetical protein
MPLQVQGCAMASARPSLRCLLSALRQLPHAAVLLLATILLAMVARAADQYLPWTESAPVALPAAQPKSSHPESAEFQFVRMIYSSGMNFGGRQRWRTDWPEAEEHLIGGIRRLTRVNVDAAGERIAIMDDALFDHPWIYAVEVGHWALDDVEASRLRDYLLRGGFLMVDDFHGSREWESFTVSLRRIFPDRPILDIPSTDPIFHAVYDIDDQVQIPGIVTLYSGVTYERDGYTPHRRGIYDDHGRLMVVINFNMDLGDAWEHADTPEYSLKYTTRAYQYAINYIVYSMTH